MANTIIMLAITFTTLCFACAASYIEEERQEFVSSFQTRREKILSAIVGFILVAAVCVSIDIGLATALFIGIVGFCLSIFPPRLFKEKTQPASLIGAIVFGGLMIYTMYFI